MEISNLDTLEKSELHALIRHIAKFLKSGIPASKSRIQPTEKQQEEEHKQLQIVLCFTQTQ